jgi:hypothetical protein
MSEGPLREELILHPIEKRILQILTKTGPASFAVIAEKAWPRRGSRS